MTKTTNQSQSRIVQGDTGSAVTSQIGGKLGVIVALLRRPEGADLGGMMEATGWQEHSIRAAIAAPLKKARGLNIISDRAGNVRVYRIAPDANIPSVAAKGRRRNAIKSKAGSAAASIQHGA
jgi:hypothetical protein